MNRNPVLHRLASLVALLFLAAADANAGVPNAPAQICVDNVCTASSTVPTSGSRPANGVKWHPGTWVGLNTSSFNGLRGNRWDLLAQRNDILKNIGSDVCGNPGVVGVFLGGVWATFEGATAGSYSAGFASVDALLEKLQSCGKRLSLAISIDLTGGMSSPCDFLPEYIVGTCSGFTVPAASATYGWDHVGNAFYAGTGSPGGAVARFWQPATTDRLIALLKAYGARYDGAPYLEQISFSETSLQIPDGVAGNSSTARLTQLKRLIAAARAAFPRTNIKIGVNDGFSDAQFIELYTYCKTYYCMFGGPDTWPGDITQADRVFAGLSISGAAVSEDFRGKMPWVAGVDWQTYDLNGSGTPLWPLATVRDAIKFGYKPTNPNGQGSFTMPSLRPVGSIWYQNHSNGNASNQWNTALKQFLIDNAPISNPMNACPTTYPGCNTD